MLTDERYSMDSNGLTIKGITQADNGQYTCRAEVKSEGRYDERRITVTVHSQYQLYHIYDPTDSFFLASHIDRLNAALRKARA